MQTHSLKHHPAHAPGKVSKVTASWGRQADDRVLLRLFVEGAEDVIMPAPETAARADGLWQATCFELFLAVRDGGYREFNFSPSGQWAAYTFAGYRKGQENHAPFSAPVVTASRVGADMTVTAILDPRELAGCAFASLTAVIAERTAGISYWAIDHPGSQPDFHNPACFVLPVP